MAPVRTPGPVDAPLAIPELQVAGYQGLALRGGFHGVTSQTWVVTGDNVNHNREVVNSIRVRWLTLYQVTTSHSLSGTNSRSQLLYLTDRICTRYSRLSTGTYGTVDCQQESQLVSKAQPSTNFVRLVNHRLVGKNSSPGQHFVSVFEHHQTKVPYTTSTSPVLIKQSNTSNTPRNTQAIIVNTERKPQTRGNKGKETCNRPSI